MTTETIAALRAGSLDLMPEVNQDLQELVTIASVNFPGYDHGPVLECAQAFADLLTERAPK